jgi:hypothetical protein
MPKLSKFKFWKKKGGGGGDDGESGATLLRTVDDDDEEEEQNWYISRGNLSGKEGGESSKGGAASAEKVPPIPSTPPRAQNETDFNQDFLPPNWPKMKYDTVKVIYEYPSKKIQKKTGYGQFCGYCYVKFKHNNATSPAAPLLLTTCRHINCNKCVVTNSRPILLNRDINTAQKHPYILAGFGHVGPMECPTCNCPFTWASVYSFYDL